MRTLLPLLLLVPAAALAQAPVQYDIRFDNRAHHEAEVRVVFPELPDRPLEVRMSRASPGRYALHGFAKNVYNVRATDGSGNALRMTKPDPYGWTVTGHDGRVAFEYTLYADHADGTYSGIDRTHAHLMMPATFVFARGLRERPVRVTFHTPAGSGWRVATQLVATDDPFTFTAPDMHYFLDSPTEVSDFDLVSWPVESDGETYTIRLAVHHQGNEADVERFAGMVQRVVAEQARIFGELPDFDHGTYTFIADYLPWVYGDGMEHRNSTILVSRRPLEGDGALGNLGTVSHEFFHAWNMERLRSDALQPFDFERVNMSRELWFGEGFTSYFDDLAIARAGFYDLERYAAGLGRGIDRVVNSPARDVRDAVDMSMYSTFVDEANWIDAQNLPNTFISYYTWGSVIALGLDLTLRTEFDGLTLEDYMRSMWERHGEPGVPYTMADLEAVLADVTGDPAFAAEFFERYVLGGEVVDYKGLLAHAGLLLRPANPGEVWIGRAALKDHPEGGAVIAGATWAGDPLYRAGLDRGDVILRLAGRAIDGAADVADVVKRHSPGDRIETAWRDRGENRTATVVLRQDPALELVPYEAAGLEVTDAMRAFREDWLGGAAAAARAEARS